MALAIKEKMIPYALRWFTGEAAPEDDDDDDEDDEEEADTEEDADDDEEEEEKPAGTAKSKIETLSKAILILSLAAVFGYYVREDLGRRLAAPSDDDQADYEVGMGNSCNDGYEAIRDEYTCAEAAAAEGARFQKSYIYNAVAPTGCVMLARHLNQDSLLLMNYGTMTRKLRADDDDDDEKDYRLICKLSEARLGPPDCVTVRHRDDNYCDCVNATDHCLYVGDCYKVANCKAAALPHWLAGLLPGSTTSEPQACIDISGTYVSTSSTTPLVTLTQDGCSGSSSEDWKYTVSGSTVTISEAFISARGDQRFVEGQISGSSGSYTIGWSVGAIFTQQQVTTTQASTTTTTTQATTTQASTTTTTTQAPTTPAPPTITVSPTTVAATTSQPSQIVEWEMHWPPADESWFFSHWDEMEAPVKEAVADEFHFKTSQITLEGPAGGRRLTGSSGIKIHVQTLPGEPAPKPLGHEAGLNSRINAGLATRGIGHTLGPASVAHYTSQIAPVTTPPPTTMNEPTLPSGTNTPPPVTFTVTPMAKFADTKPDAEMERSSFTLTLGLFGLLLAAVMVGVGMRLRASQAPAQPHLYYRGTMISMRNTHAIFPETSNGEASLE